MYLAFLLLKAFLKIVSFWELPSNHVKGVEEHEEDEDYSKLNISSDAGRGRESWFMQHMKDEDKALKILQPTVKSDRAFRQMSSR